jgi:phosphomannomutase
VTVANLDRIFKAYDVRGVVPDELDPAVARRIGAAYADWVKAPRILIGRDARLSSPELAAAIADGITSRGVDVVDLGLASTDLMYFASGSLDLPGVMITASHNPKEYNGLKFCRAGAAPVGVDSGLRDIRAIVEGPESPPVPTPGRIETADLLDVYTDHVLSFVDVSAMRPLTIAVDTANGMGGLVVPPVMARLPVSLHHLYPELDGTFPNHPADPIDPENQKALKAEVLDRGADVGLAFDGDADRVFLVDEHADDVSGSLMTALVAGAMLRREPGAKVVYNLICSWVVPEVIRERGGIPVRTRVGHSFIKQVMAETGAIFGGEHSGHYYFRDNYRADSGLIAAVVALGELSAAGVALSQLLKPFRRYFDSGEINTRVDDPQGRIEAIAAALADGRQDRLDGTRSLCSA